MTAKTIDLNDYLTLLEELESKRKGELMVGFRPRRTARATYYRRRVVPLPGHRFVYHRKGTENREVHEDGTVWCTRHDVQLREYPDKRGHVQRKCRPCQNEYMVRWKARARERAGGETTTVDDRRSPVQT